MLATLDAQFRLAPMWMAYIQRFLRIVPKD